jgi:hypothetical protein
MLSFAISFMLENVKVLLSGIAVMMLSPQISFSKAPGQ